MLRHLLFIFRISGLGGGSVYQLANVDLHLVTFYFYD